MISYEYRAQMMNGTIKDVKDNYENAEGNAEKEKYEIEIQRLQSLQNAYKTAGEYEAKAKAFDKIMKVFENSFGDADSLAKFKVFTEVENAYIESGELK